MTVPQAVVWVGSPAGGIEYLALSAQIHHGRDDATSQPEAPSATIEMVGALPAAAVIGARVGLVARFGGTDYPRFTGTITDLRLEWDTVDTPRPVLIAVGDLGRTGRRVIGDTPWPEELDGARVSRILGLAGFTPDPLLSDPGTVAILARDVDRQPALPLAQATADDGAGLVWQDRQGRIRYADALHRRGSAVALALVAGEIGLDGAGWEASLEGLANDVVIRYGPTPSGGDQAQVTARNTASVTARGTYGASLTTAIANVTDAQKRADLIVARQAVPGWIFGGLGIELTYVDDATTAGVLALEMHDLISVTGLPAGSPATSAYLWVEGWRETIEQSAWAIAMATSDYCRTAGAARWDDLAPSATWNAMDPALTWDGAYCSPPAPPRGRWDDVAATTRWDTADPSLTWDTWPY